MACLAAGWSILATKQKAFFMTVSDIAKLLQAALGPLVRQQEYAGLTALQLLILHHVYMEKGPHTARSIASNISPAQTDRCTPVSLEVAKAIEGLTDRGLVSRQDNPDGERLKLVVRTAKGVGLIERIIWSMKQAGDAAELAEREAQAAQFSLPGVNLVTQASGAGHGPDH